MISGSMTFQQFIEKPREFIYIYGKWDYFHFLRHPCAQARLRPHRGPRPGAGTGLRKPVPEAGGMAVHAARAGAAMVLQSAVVLLRQEGRGGLSAAVNNSVIGIPALGSKPPLTGGKSDAPGEDFFSSPDASGFAAFALASLPGSMRNLRAFHSERSGKIVFRRRSHDSGKRGFRECGKCGEMRGGAGRGVAGKGPRAVNGGMLRLRGTVCRGRIRDCGKKLASRVIPLPPSRVLVV